MRIRAGYLSAGDVREEAKPGVGLDSVVQPALYAVNCDQPNLLQLQPDSPSQIAHRNRLLNLDASAPRLIGKQLAKYFDVDGHDVPYKVSNTESRSESGTSNTTLCGGNGSSRIYSGMR